MNMPMARSKIAALGTLSCGPHDVALGVLWVLIGVFGLLSNDLFFLTNHRGEKTCLINFWFHI